jgi:hypothetical protein
LVREFGDMVCMRRVNMAPGQTMIRSSNGAQE